MTLESFMHPIRDWHIPISHPDSVGFKELLEVWDEVIENDIYDTVDIVSPDDVWLDVGSHLGFFSIAAMMSGAKWCMLVDSDRERLNHGCWNARRYDCLRHAERGEIGASGYIYDGQAGRFNREVKSIYDLPFEEEYNGAKFDIQGAEKGVLADGCAEWLAERLEKIVMEWHYPNDDPAEALGEHWDVQWTKPHEDVLLNTKTLIVYAVSKEHA